ncbi:MAG: alpha-N-arabinofuranosidase [Bifidobacteriaceae bacterium]|nr:alpha-N-arabinofuranosidase [Bifidobacteriaceae bacterium]
MRQATITLDIADVVAPARRRIFGSFVEHLGRAVYGGIYEPGHPSAGEDGLRQDVIDLIRDLGVTTVRYPGGNFVSGYRWKDGIGPKQARPRRLDLAWHSTEPNQFGVDEFMAWSRRTGTEAMMAVNLGTGGIQEAVELLEYCNHSSGTELSDLRRANGALDPYDIRVWCLGNEMDGEWQIGHKTASEYGRLAAETARAMRMFDPGLVLVASGSSSAEQPTFGSWEAEVLLEAYDQIDLISAHQYHWETNGDLQGFLASGARMDRFIEDIIASADHIRARLRSNKRVNISFDEWNVWYLHDDASQPPTGTDWPVGPRLLEDHYNVADAVVVGSLLISLLKHADRVEAASLAQLVNVIAPIITEPGGPAWRQTIFHPFAQAANNASGEVVRLAVQAPRLDREDLADVTLLDAVATNDSGVVTVFIVNRCATDRVQVTLDLRSVGGYVPRQCTVLTDTDLRRVVGPHDSQHFGPIPLKATWDDDGAVLDLPRASWAMVQVGAK